MSSQDIDVTVEIPYGSNLKYEMDDNGDVRLDRVLSCSMTYPGNYGFIADTLAEDGDPLDVLIIVPYILHPGCKVKCRVIGALVMSDEKGLDEKILAVPVEDVDPYYKDWVDIDNISKPYLEKIRHFFEHYKKTDADKWTEVKDFLNKEQSEVLVTKYSINTTN